MEKYFFLAIFLFIFLTKGCCGCSTDDIKVDVGLSGKQVKGKPEYAVTVYNTCNCPVGGIVLWCPDFKTVESISLHLFSRSAIGHCLINGGRNIPPGTFIGFSYAWDEEFSFPVIKSNPHC